MSHEGEARIKEIVSLAHTGKAEDLAEYKRRQAELHELLVQRDTPQPVSDLQQFHQRFKRQAAAYARRAIGR
jgi:hypothetical protein